MKGLLQPGWVYLSVGLFWDGFVVGFTVELTVNSETNVPASTSRYIYFENDIPILEPTELESSTISSHKQ
jgi:hypothetical protein